MGHAARRGKAGELPTPFSWGGPPSHPGAFTPPRCSSARDNWSVWCVPLSWLGSPSPSKPLCSSKLICPASTSSEACYLTALLLCHGYSSSSFTCPWSPGTNATCYFPPLPIIPTSPWKRPALAGTAIPALMRHRLRHHSECKKDSEEQRTDSGPTRQRMNPMSLFKESSNLLYTLSQAME